MTINNPRSYSMDNLTESPEVNDTHDCFRENREFLNQFYPGLRDCPTIVSLMCLLVIPSISDWFSYANVFCRDAFTQSQSFFAKRVGDNLYCVGGGSFHGWKFLPVLAQLMASQLQIDVDIRDETQKRWEELTKEREKHSGLRPSRSWV